MTSKSANPVSTLQRRQVSVLFCDMVGSTTLADTLDAEDYRDILRHFQGLCESVIEGYDGYVGQFLGDGLVAYFGHPKTSEDAAERSIRAALELIDRIGMVTAGGAFLQARLAIATGTVLVGDSLGRRAARQTAITGKVPVVASRLQQLAPPMSLVIADSTKRLAEEIFDFVDFGSHELKGIPEPIHAWQVARERPVSWRFDAQANNSSRSLIGRDDEFSSLTKAWAAASSGETKSVAVIGEAGIGKSALAAALRDHVATQGGRWIAMQTSQRHIDSPFHPVVSALQDRLGRNLLVDPVSQRGELETRAEQLGFGAATSRLIQLLIDFDPKSQTTSAPISVSGAAPAQIIFDAFQASALSGGALIILEDAHWADHSTVDLFSKLTAARIPGLMIMVLSREALRWWTEASGIVLKLPRLGLPFALALARSVASKDIAEPVIERIAKVADGIPLFLQEMTRYAIEHESSLAARAIPSSLNDGLVARLDLASGAKDTVEAAAVIGRRFSLPLLLRVTRRPRSRIVADIDLLLSLNLIGGDEASTNNAFEFKHALLHEAAYQGIPRKRLTKLHALCAEALEHLGPSQPDFDIHQVANHWTESGRFERAASLWLDAGRTALSRSGNLEAMSILSRALASSRKSPLVEGRHLLELNIQLALAQACYVAQGPAHPDTIKAYTMAQALVDVVEDRETVAKVLYGIFAAYHFAAKFDLAERPARRLMAFALQEDRQGDLCQAHRMLGYIAFFRGECRSAIAHYEELLRLYRREDHGPQAYLFGADCRVGTQGFHAVIEAAQGHYDQAIKRAEDNLSFAETLEHPASIGWAYAAQCYVRFLGDEPELALSISQTGAAYCRKHSIASWHAHCKIFELWACGRLGNASNFVAPIRQLLNAASVGNKLGICVFRLVLAETLLEAGLPADALSEVALAAQDIASSGQEFFAPLAAYIRAKCMVSSSDLSDDALAAVVAATNLSRSLGLETLATRSEALLSRHSSALSI